MPSKKKSTKRASGAYPRRAYQPDGFGKNFCGKRVQALRLAQGWSQEDMAAQLSRRSWDVSRLMVAKIELGLREISDHEVRILATTFRVTPNDLLLDR